jgi:hypothetical protein
MALNHLKSFDLVGKKEEVSDIISLITPSDTPFLSSIGTEKIGNDLYQWQEDQLRAVAVNAKLQGADGVDTTRDQPTMRTNGTQILSETFKIAGTTDAIKTYGRDKTSLRELMKTGKLLKMDLEHALVGTGQTYVVAAEATAGQFAGVQAQIGAGTTTTLGTAGPITETLIIDLHQKLYNEGSDGTILMVKPSDSRIIAGFSQASGRSMFVDNGQTKVTNVVNIYESPFGTVRVTKNRRIRSQNALIYDPKNWKLAVLRNWFTKKLAETGDSERWMAVGEFGLKHANRLASAQLANLT